jgi:hypothetical protein
MNNSSISKDLSDFMINTLVRKQVYRLSLVVSVFYICMPLWWLIVYLLIQCVREKIPMSKAVAKWNSLTCNGCANERKQSGSQKILKEFLDHDANLKECRRRRKV